MSIFKSIKNIFANATVGHFKNYFSANFLVKAISLLYIPILTRLVSTADYGLINVFFSYLTIFGVIFTLNLHNSVNRYAFEEKSDLKEFMGSTIFGSSGILIIFLVPFSLFPNFFAELLTLPVEMIYLLFPMVIFSTLHSIFNQLFIAKEKSSLVRNVNFFYTLAQVTLTVLILVLVLNEKLYLGPILGQICAGIIFAGIIIYHLKNYFKPSFDWGHIKYMANYSVPLIPGVLGGVILAQFDRIMINGTNGSSEAGLYSFAYNIGALLIIVTESLLQAWQPKFYREMNQGNTAFLSKDFGMLFKGIVFASIGLIFFGEELGMILGTAEYNVAVKIVPVIVIGYMFFSMYKIFEVQIAFTRKTIWISVLYIICGALNIILNWIFLPKYGYAAGAWTTLASFGLMAILTASLNKYILKQFVPGIGTFLQAIIVFTIGIGIFYFILSQELSIIIGFLLKSIIVALLILGLFYKEARMFLKEGTVKF